MKPSKKTSYDCLLQTVPVIALFALIASGCATSGRAIQENPGDAAYQGNARVAQPGDKMDIQYVCRLQSGEIVAATDIVPENQPKSNVFIMKKETGPLSITAVSPEKPQPEKLAPLPLEDEIQDQLARIAVGMREGEKRQVELTAQEILPKDGQGGIARISRVRTRPKEMIIPKGDYEFRAHKAPEPGQSFAIDPAFPGRVESVTDTDVVVRFTAKPGDVVQTPFGPGRIREEGNEYKVDIDAKEGSLIRTGNKIGRISLEGNDVIAVNYRHPFGYEKLACDVTLEKVADGEPEKSGE